MSHPVPKKLTIKLYARGELPPTERVVERFHAWIQAGALPETMIDVIEYGHVHEGQSVLLVGHESDYAIDHAEGRAGLFYQRKRVLSDEPAERLAQGLGRVLGAAARLESELPGVAFRTDEILVRFLDRLAAPNDDATFSRAQPELAAFAARALGDGARVERVVGDPREAFAVRLLAASDEGVSAVRARLGA